MAQRIVRNRSATLTHTFLENGVPTDPYPDAATVTIERDNLEVIVADAPTDNLAPPGRAAYTLTPDQTALLDRLHMTWYASFGGRVQTYETWVEVVGGTYFTLGDARGRPALSDVNNTTDAQLLDLRTLVEDAIERRTGRAFVPRYAHDTVIPGRRGVRLLHPVWVRAIRGVVCDATAPWDAGALANLRVDAAGYLYSRVAPYGPGVGYGVSEADILYEHGADEVPHDIARAALDWVEYLAGEQAGSGIVDPQASRLVTDDGIIEYSRNPGIAPPTVASILSSYTVLVA